MLMKLNGIKIGQQQYLASLTLITLRASTAATVFGVRPSQKNWWPLWKTTERVRIVFRHGWLMFQLVPLICICACKHVDCFRFCVCLYTFSLSRYRKQLSHWSRQLFGTCAAGAHNSGHNGHSCNIEHGQLCVMEKLAVPLLELQWVRRCHGKLPCLRMSLRMRYDVDAHMSWKKSCLRGGKEKGELKEI